MDLNAPCSLHSLLLSHRALLAQLPPASSTQHRPDRSCMPLFSPRAPLCLPPFSPSRIHLAVYGRIACVRATTPVHSGPAGCYDRFWDGKHAYSKHLNGYSLCEHSLPLVPRKSRRISPLNESLSAAHLSSPRSPACLEPVHRGLTALARPTRITAAAPPATTPRTHQSMLDTLRTAFSAPVGQPRLPRSMRHIEVA